MRKDMKRVLITRPRLGSRHGRNTDTIALRNQSVDINDNSEPKRRSIKPKRHKWYHKSLNEYLNPLKRYLSSSVGRSWNDVYSEIKASSPADTVIGAHIYQHLFHFICVQPEVIDGVYYRRSHTRRLLVIRSGDLYVDRHGFIRDQINEKHQDSPYRYTKEERRKRRKRNKHKKSYQRVQAPSCIALGPHEELIRSHVDSEWYYVRWQQGMTHSQAAISSVTTRVLYSLRSSSEQQFYSAAECYIAPRSLRLLWKI